VHSTPKHHFLIGQASAGANHDPSKSLAVAQ